MGNGLEQYRASIGQFHCKIYCRCFKKCCYRLNESSLFHNLLFIIWKTCKSMLWFESYLADKKQCVFIGNSKSPLENTSAGVPQGSVLGPLLFLIYVNDISDNLTSLTRLFADDTSLSYCSQSPYTIENILNSDLDLVKFKPQKTKALIFSGNIIQEDITGNITFQNENVEKISFHKYMGVTFDNDGKFHSHILNIIRSVSQRLCALRIRKLKFILNRNYLS